MWGDNWVCKGYIVPCLGAGDGAELPRVPGAWGADGWAVGDVAAPCPAIPGRTGVMNWPGLSTGRDLAARLGLVPRELGREGLSCHLVPSSKQLLFGKAGARHQRATIGHGTSCAPFLWTV